MASYSAILFILKKWGTLYMYSHRMISKIHKVKKKKKRQNTRWSVAGYHLYKIGGGEGVSIHMHFFFTYVFSTTVASREGDWVGGKQEKRKT